VSCTKDILPPSERNDILRFSRKALAATATLGTGNSLGPEGPSVEAGMSISRLMMNNELFSRLTTFFGTLEDNDMSEVQRVNRKLSRDRLLLACGAAAGVSAGFNAPLSGVFFALEVVQSAFRPIDIPMSNEKKNDDETQIATIGGDALASQQINISAILLASVVSALTIQLLLGNKLALKLGAFDFNNPLAELPLYLVLGVMSGVTAATFSGVAQFLKNLFDGKEGPAFVQDTFLSIPKYAKPLIGSVICGIVAIYVPEVLFFGYETLNSLFLISGGYIPTGYLLIMLVAKLLTTASSASSGLVGGTFAPSLFLGGVLGAGFHNVITDSLQSITHAYPQLTAYPIFQGVSGLPVFAMVGAASVLAALFRAPLTASLLLFECTGNYDVILPLMASAGVASLTGDIVEKWLDEEQRESDNVSWGDLAMRTYEEIDDDICLTPPEIIE
jgi:H+/Cl- antiporter ClcA